MHYSSLLDWMKLQKQNKQNLAVVFVSRPFLPVATQERKPPEFIVSAKSSNLNHEY